MTSRRKLYRRGSLLVEAALILPILLLLTFGAIEYGWLFLKAQQVENIARQAARTGALPSGSANGVSTLTSQMMTDAGLANSGYTLSVTRYPGQTAVDVATLTTGELFTVKVQIPYSNIGITNAPLIPVPSALMRSVTMAKEGW